MSKKIKTAISTKGLPTSYVPPKSFLTFIKRTNNIGAPYQVPFALYKCVCGTKKEIAIWSVKSGNTVSCGCYNREMARKTLTTHGVSKHPLSDVYRNMISRCNNPKSKYYQNYGGRGVKVCDEWMNSYYVFYLWCMENGWQKGLQLDKDIKARKMGLPSNLYSPERCSFVTRKENLNCMRNNVLIEYMGETKTLTQWADEYKIHESTIRSRLSYGWDMYDVLNKPIRKMVNNSNRYK